jgi:hypothetical protein
MRTPWFRTPAGYGLIAFTITFSALTVLGVTLMRVGTRPFALHPPAPWIGSLGPEWWLAYAGRDARHDLHLLMDRREPLASNARRADVVLVGNSRTQFAFPPAVIDRIQHHYGIRVVNLASAAATYETTLEVLARLDVQAPMIVVNIEGFFEPERGRLRDQVDAEGPWGGVALGFETQAQARLAPVWTRVFPQFVGRGVLPGYVLRSVRTGAWRPMDWPHRDRVVKDDPPRRMSYRRRLFAWRIMSRLRRHGATVVLTCVPASRGTFCDPREVEQLAGVMLAPAIMPPHVGLTAGDSSHLCPRSGKRFGRLFFRALLERPEFRRLLDRGR